MGHARPPKPRRDRRGAHSSLARAPGGTEPRSDPGPDRAAGRSATSVSGDPPDRDQRQGQHRSHDGVAAPCGRAAYGTIHLATRVERDRADHHQRRVDQRGAFRRDLARDRPVRRIGRRAPDRWRTDDVLRDHHGNGVRGLRRCARRRGGHRGGPGRHLGCHQRGRCRGGGDHADRRRPRPSAGRHHHQDRHREGGDHQAGGARHPRRPVIGAAQVLLERCAEVGALPQREGIDFG